MTCTGRLRFVWHVTNEDFIGERNGVFTPDEHFKVIRYTFLRQRHVREVPEEYEGLCNI